MADHDHLKTQLQETGRCWVGGLTVAEIVAMLDELGIDPRLVRLGSRGSLRVLAEGRE